MILGEPWEKLLWTPKGVVTYKLRNIALEGQDKKRFRGSSTGAWNVYVLHIE